MTRTTDGSSEGWPPQPLAERHRLSVLPSPAELLAAHGLAAAAEEPFPNDGWSGAQLTALIAPDGRRFVLKRDAWERDWICRATADSALREACLAALPPVLPEGIRAPFLGVARDGRGYLLLMPDLTGRLFDWQAVIDPDALERVLAGMARLHTGWSEPPAHDPVVAFPWCPLDRRLLLLTRACAEAYHAEGLPVARRFLDGWAAFEHHAPREAVDLVERLAADPAPLLTALGRLPAAHLHGDLKLANVGFDVNGALLLVDWQMTLVAPVAVELGWFVVSNSGSLPMRAEVVLRRALEVLAATPGGEAALGDAGAQADLAILVGLLLRGWRKGLDVEAGERLPAGRAADDLRWWCRRALEAAGRRL
ncbi:MAG TPA: hypothetical protein VFK38_05380 [Candidatus Limnocylindrales bacterium]|nr:hypothetical protein [Candidatus Limnocylindrales bacterium]